VHPGWGGVVLAAGGWGDSHGAEEGVESDGDAGGEGSGHAVAVERDDAGVGVREVVGEEAAASAEGVAGPGDVDGDLEDADLEDVAGFGLFDGYGSGEDVAAGAALGGGDFGVDVGYVGGYVGGFDAEGLEALGWAAGGEGLHDDGVAGVDGEGGFGAGGVVSPGYGGGRGEEGLGLLGGCGDGRQTDENGSGKDIRYGFSVVHFVSVSLPVGEGLGVLPSLGYFAQILQTKYFRSGPWLQSVDSKGDLLQIPPKIGLSCCLTAKAGLDFGLSPCVYYMRGVKGFWVPEGKLDRGLRRDKGGIMTDGF
jgi:hypothetical protein